MKTIYVKKQINCRFGISLFPFQPYQANRESSGRWLVKVSDVVWVMIDAKNIKIVG